jgi:hypothetical protein
MPIGFLAPKGQLEKKPPHGDPCTSCGLCCVATLCPLGRKVFGHELGPCPALMWDEGKSSCGLVREPMKHARLVTMKAGVPAASAAAAHLVGAGTGCDARVNGEKPNHEFYDRLRIWDRLNAAKTRAARKLWGV